MTKEGRGRGGLPLARLGTSLRAQLAFLAGGYQNVQAAWGAVRKHDPAGQATGAREKTHRRPPLAARQSVIFLNMAVLPCAQDFPSLPELQCKIQSMDG
jgi:hypothetical protein